MTLEEIKNLNSLITIKKISSVKSAPKKKLSGPYCFLGNIQNSQERNQSTVNKLFQRLEKEGTFLVLDKIVV